MIHLLTRTTFAFHHPIFQKPIITTRRHLSSTATTTTNQIISFCTDIEGDNHYLDRFVQHSKVLQYSSDDGALTFRSPYGMFVYGGDIWDKGGNDVSVLKQLLDLKRRYPNRVRFLMGNRDINKMRLFQELNDEDDDDEDQHHHGGVYWLKGSKRKGDPEQNGLGCVSSVERLKWMLQSTMGSPDAFELRRNELGGRNVTDEEVLRSYRETCFPGGMMDEYLSNANLIWREGEVLFMHGALPLTDDDVERYSKENGGSIWDDFRFAMPWIQPSNDDDDDGDSNRVVTTTNDWIEALNTFAKHQIHQWKTQPTPSSSSKKAAAWSTNGGYTPQNGNSLLQYGMGWLPNRKQNPTVVYSSWCRNGMPYLPETKQRHIREFFHKSNLRMIVSGHQPHGDLPLPIQMGDGKWIIMCDTSYSGDVHWVDDRKTTGRGVTGRSRGDVAFSELIIEQSSDTQQITNMYQHGVLSDGTPYESVNLLHSDKIGKQVVDPTLFHIENGGHCDDKTLQWWIKTKLKDGRYVLTASRMYDVWNAIGTLR